jgi:hypothetical protein
MDPEKSTLDQLTQDVLDLHEKIDELTAMLEENSRMTKGLYDRTRFLMLVSAIKWFIIIGLTIGAFYFVQPFIDTIVSVYGGVTGGSGSDLFNLIKSI